MIHDWLSHGTSSTDNPEWARQISDVFGGEVAGRH